MEVRGLIHQKSCWFGLFFHLLHYIVSDWLQLIDIIGVQPNAVLSCWYLCRYSNRIRRDGFAANNGKCVQKALHSLLAWLLCWESKARRITAKGRSNRTSRLRSARSLRLRDREWRDRTIARKVICSQPRCLSVDFSNRQVRSVLSLGSITKEFPPESEDVIIHSKRLWSLGLIHSRIAIDSPSSRANFGAPNWLERSPDISI